MRLKNKIRRKHNQFGTKKHSQKAPENVGFIRELTYTLPTTLCQVDM